MHRVGILGLFCPKQGQGFGPSVSPLHPNMGQVSPPPNPWDLHVQCNYKDSNEGDC